MFKIRWTSSARSDLLELVDYIAEENIQAAEKFISRIEKMEQNISDFQSIGFSLETALPIRQILVKPARLLYIKNEEEITIIACVHQSRDWQSLLESRNVR